MEKKISKMIRGSKDRPEDVRKILNEWGAITFSTDLNWFRDEHTLFYVNDRNAVVGVPDNDSILECLNYKEETLPPLPEKKADEEIELPKTWEEFCKTHNVNKNHMEYFINNDSKILYKDYGGKNYGGVRSTEYHKNLLPNHETAEAILALCQLIQLRDCYNEGWQPDWNEVTENKYCVTFFGDDVLLQDIYTCHKASFLIFKTAELRDEFLDNFKDLIKQVHPLFGIIGRMENGIPFKAIGETLEYKGHLVMVKKAENFLVCEKCFFKDKEICDNVQCGGVNRPDKESVYFVEVTMKGGKK